jgi:hypothetical protein
MEKKIQNLELAREAASSGRTTPLELIRLMGGRAKKVRSQGAKTPDSMLAVYKNRLTYTFILEGEVASIHYDHEKGEIFFKGHNIKHLELSDGQKAALFGLVGLLEADPEASELYGAYQATLDKVVADK